MLNNYFQTSQSLRAYNLEIYVGCFDRRMSSEFV